MDLDEQTTDNGLVLPDSIYTATLPSLVYALDELGDLSLFPELGSRQSMDTWGLEEFGSTYEAPIVHRDGRMNGAQQPPEYYAYSPDRSETWEDGVQAIEDHDWASTKTEYEQEDTTNASTPEVTTERDFEPAVLSRTEFDHHNTEIGQDPGSPKLPVQEELANQTCDGEVSSPPWIASPVRIQKSNPISVPEDAHQNAAMIPEVETEMMCDNDIPMDDEVEIESANGAMTLTSDPRHAKSSPVHEQVLHGGGGIDEAQDDPGVNDIVSGMSALLSKSGEKSHGTTILAATSQNDTAHIHELEGSLDSPARPSDPLAPSTANCASQPSISDEDIQQTLQTTAADVSLQDDAAGEVPEGLLAPSSSGHIAMEEPRKNISSPEPRDDAEEPESEAHEEILSSENMSESTLAQANEPEVMKPEQLENSGAVMEQSRDLPPLAVFTEGLSTPTSTEAITAADQQSAPESSLVASDHFKRSRSRSMDALLDSEQETPAKKKIKANESAQPTAAEPEPAAEKIEDTEPKLLADDSKRHILTKSPKEAKDGDEPVTNGAPKTKRKSKYTLKQPKQPPTKPISKEADIYFEDDIRPNADGSVPALLHTDTNEDNQTILSEDDEHLSDATDPPPASTPHIPLRTPKNIVSNRELASLGSTLAPGMHLSMHNHLSATPARVRKSTETPTSVPSVNSFMIDEGEDTPAVKKTRGGKKTVVPRKGSARARKMVEQRAEQVSDADSHDLFPELKNKDDGGVKTSTPVVSKKGKSSEGTSEAVTGRRQTRSRNDATSKSKSKPEDEDEEYANPSDASDSPAPKPTITNSKKKTLARSAVRKKVATPSTTKTTTPAAAKSAPAKTPAGKNKFGFSPRKTRRVSKMEDQEKEENIGKRLRKRE